VLTPSASITPLLALPALRRVVLRGIHPRAHQEDLQALEARGVVVDRWPPPDPMPCAPFVDPMLKLAVIEALVKQGRLAVPPLVPVDEFQLDLAHLARLVAMPLSKDQLAAVHELRWGGGGMQMQHLVWPQYTGEEEGDPFAIRTLTGIEALTGLRRVRFGEGALVGEALRQVNTLQLREEKG
jgi:hypothetical protein